VQHFLVIALAKIFAAIFCGAIPLASFMLHQRNTLEKSRIVGICATLRALYTPTGYPVPFGYFNKFKYLQ
jgi:hypothetical protein